MGLLNKKNLYVHIPAHYLISAMGQFLRMGLNAEIYISSDFIDYYSEENIEIINSNFEKYNLSKIIHGPFIDLNAGSSDIQIRQKTLERFLSTMELCKRLKARSVVFHSHFEPIFYGRHFQKWFENSYYVWDEIAMTSVKDSVAVYIENSIDTDTGAVNALLEKYLCFGACFDVAHYNVFNPMGWQDALSKYPLGSIKEVHLSDNNGKEDSHMPLGDGSIDFEKLFDEIVKRREEPIFTIESHSKECLEKSLNFIRRFIDE